VKAVAWCGLALLVIPGCLLVQPLDEAKPDQDDSASSGGETSHAGSAGQHAGGSPAAGGAGNKAGSGSGATSGSASAGRGGASSGVDFSLFTGSWTITGGKRVTTCDGSTPQTETVAPGGTDTIGLGTSSDLIFGPGTACEILSDVDDRSATLNSGTSTCAYSDENGEYELSFDSFEFTVSGDGKTAKFDMTTSVLFTDLNDEAHVCSVDSNLDYKR